MGYREDMEHCRNYIGEHCSDELSIDGLAQLFGYSLFHFCHVFKSCNEMSVGEYLRDTRLSKAAADIINGMSVTEASLTAGYDTPSGFTRAFRRQFGMTPSEYKKLKGDAVIMKPEIKKVEAFSAVGYSFALAEDVNILDNGAFWLDKDFSGVSKADYAKLTYPGYAEIGAWIHPSDKTGELYYFFGPQTHDTSFIPDGMLALEFPAAEYAVFKVPASKDAKELKQNVIKTWKYVFNDWFDNSDYKFNHTSMDFEFYLGEDAFIYVPVLKK